MYSFELFIESHWLDLLQLELTYLKSQHKLLLLQYCIVLCWVKCWLALGDSFVLMENAQSTSQMLETFSNLLCVMRPRVNCF